MGPQQASPTVPMGWVETNEGSGSVNNLAICLVVSDLVDKTTFSETRSIVHFQNPVLKIRNYVTFPIYQNIFLLALPHYVQYNHNYFF